MKTEVNHVPTRMLYGPAAYCARGIENLLLFSKETGGVTHLVSCLAAKSIALTVFPTTLAIGIVVESAFLCRSIVKYYTNGENGANEWAYSAERIEKLVLGIIFTPLAVIAADGISYLFLERVPLQLDKIQPFGVEKVYGTKLTTPVYFPSTIEELQAIVKEAKQTGKKISIIGAGMSQGEQTIPNQTDGIAVNLRNLKQVTPAENDCIKAQAGAIWEEVQLEANKLGLSVIVKQASGVFSVGGSIGINCHGWQHASGAIASIVESLEIIDANGDLRTVSRQEDPELFNCMFGTLGYFGIVVSATMRLEKNGYLRENGIEVPIEEFVDYYKQNIRGDETKPLLMGRLNVDGKPLTKVVFNTFEKILPEPDLPVITDDFSLEPHRGKRKERIFLDAMSHLPKMLYDPLMQAYWDLEMKTMEEHRIATRNEFMHFGVKSFFQLHQSDLYTQWLQEYFISEENLPQFLAYLSDVLEENNVRVLNASIRPTPRDQTSILPYAEKDRYAIVISFSQLKTKKEIAKTEKWAKQVQGRLLEKGDKWYQAYMPFSNREEFEACYGVDVVNNMRDLKQKYDPDNLFSNKHTVKYYDVNK